MPYTQYWILCTESEGNCIDDFPELLANKGKIESFVQIWKSQQVMTSSSSAHLKQVWMSWLAVLQMCLFLCSNSHNTAWSFLKEQE